MSQSQLDKKQKGRPVKSGPQSGKQDLLSRVEETLNDLRDDVAVWIALSKSDVVEEASKIVVNEAYSDKNFQARCRKFIGRHTRRVRSGK